MVQSNADVWPLGKNAAMGALAVAVLLGVFDFGDRMIISSVFPYLKDAYSLSDAQLGFLSGIVNFALAILVVPTAFFVDRWSRKKMIAIMMVFWAAGSGLSAFAGTFAALLCARFLIGFGESAYTPATQSLLAASFPMRWRTTALGLQQYGTNVGCMLGLAIGAFIAAHWDWHDAIGIMCIPGLLVGLSALALRDFPNPPKSESGAGQSWAAVIRTLLGNRSLVCVHLAQSVMLCYGYTLSIWYLTYLNRVGGMDIAVAGSFGVLFLITSSTSILVSGPLNDWLRSRSRVLSIRVIAVLVAVGFAMNFVALTCLEPASGLQIFLMVAQNACTAPLIGLGFALNADLTVPAMRGTSTSLMLVMMNVIGTGCGPILLGLLSDELGGLGNGLTVLSFCLVITSALYFYLSFRYQRDLPNAL